MSHWAVGVCTSVIFLYIKYMAGTEYNHRQGRMTEIQIRRREIQVHDREAVIQSRTEREIQVHDREAVIQSWTA